ncbi:hypothetical protein CHS0354_018155 [Potamilus streckersoni]|uniref:Protein kinase domain-containing protein n=1 Tax=Potamilus streckersoni TaxID=2493646 RepID=A0AAE0ST04_9BIVA|nr:hypothetical protein CHS0354_018155 [Potamilus streckersoni]
MKDDEDNNNNTQDEKKKKVTNESRTEETSRAESSLRKSKKPPNDHILEAQGIIIGKTLGKGSFAVVKSAYDVNRRIKVAVKIILKKEANQEYLNKFLPREMDTMRICNHPNLISVYQLIETTSRHFFIMEFTEKGDLLELIKQQKYIEENLAGRWFTQLYDGITYLHDRSIAHRDIKCENLLLDQHYTLKVSDFGFSKQVHKAKSGTVALSETYCGSYAYAAPELLKGIAYNVFLSDVWSTGVVLYTMVYGLLPFDDSDHKKLLKQVQSTVKFPTTPVVSNKCQKIILKMLAKLKVRVHLKKLGEDEWFKEHYLRRETGPPPEFPSPKKNMILDLFESTQMQDSQLETESSNL